MADLPAVLDGLDLVVGLADGHLHPDDVARARRGARAARDLSGFVGDTLVLAVVGGTGSGKSSLVNALVGEQVASVSPVRPHTAEPLAVVPEDPDDGLEVLLDRLGVVHRARQARFPGVALLDMADIDSIEAGHRVEVERLLPQIDGMIWVFDPVKYADPVVHDEFLAPLAESAGRFVFVLNQIDRVGPDERGEIVTDLLVRLRADGIPRPEVFAVAADPPGRGPVGIDPLGAHLAGRLDAKRLQLGRTVAAARQTARMVADAAGVRAGGSLGFEQRWGELLQRVTTSLSLAGAARGPVEDALCALEDLVGDLAAGAQGPFAVRLRNSFGAERLERELRGAIAEMELAVPRLRRVPGRDAVLDPEERAAAAEVLEAELQRRIGGPLREVVWERASLTASLAGLLTEVALTEAALERRSSRRSPG